MTDHFGILILTALANLILGAVILVRGPANRVNIYFALFSSAIAVWTLSNGLVNLYAAAPSGIIWARLAFAAASIIPLSFLQFARAFPSLTSPPADRIATVLVVAGSLMFVLSFTPAIARTTTAYNGILQVAYGILHPLFGVYFVSALGYSLFVLARKSFALKGLEKLQVRYVFLAVALAGLGATATNLVIPLVFRSSRFSPYGPAFSLLMMALIAHSIIRYRLMNIRWVIRRGAAYLLAVTAASAVFALLAFAASRGSFSPLELPLWLQLLFALLIALLFQPLKDRFKNLLNSYFFRQPYDYERSIREISRTMATLLDLDSLLNYACDVITKTVRPEHVTIYAADEGASVYKPLVTRSNIGADAVNAGRTYSATDSLPKLLSAHKKHLAVDHLSPSTSRSVEAMSELQLVGAACVFPILEREELAGFFLLGSKLSGDPYFSEDVDLLTTLVSQASIAIKNARLYSQVLLANEYVENILATMDSAVVAVAADGSITLLNSGARRLTGVKAGDVSRMSLDGLPSSLAVLLRATLLDRSPRTQVEGVVHDAAGNSTPVICSTSPLKDGQGKVVGAVAVFSDLSRIKKLEGEKRQVERLASVGALASGLAHEIKNPLVAIKTFAELLPERFVDEDFRSDFSQVVIREIGRIDDLIARLRSLATPHSQKLIPLDITEPIDETIALLRAQLEQGQISVRTAYGHAGLLIRGDAAQLKQLFLNIFINALEAMGSGGELTVRTGHRDTSAGKTVFVEVQDTGPGIPAGMVGEIFNPFVTTKQSGSGLGLSISRGIADAHRASITAHNNSGPPGAVVVVEFPALDEAPYADLRDGTQLAYPNPKPNNVNHTGPIAIE